MYRFLYFVMCMQISSQTIGIYIVNHNNLTNCLTVWKGRLSFGLFFGFVTTLVQQYSDVDLPAESFLFFKLTESALAIYLHLWSVNLRPYILFNHKLKNFWMIIIYQVVATAIKFQTIKKVPSLTMRA